MYKTNFKELRQVADLSPMLTALEKGFEKFGIDFYLVGAVARDLWLTAINDIRPSRITGDIDFAVFINNRDTYNHLREYLIKDQGFAPYKGNDFVLLWRGYLQVDLLPFGAIEGKGNKVNVEGSGLTSLNFPGFKEVYDSGLPEAELDGKHKFKFCTLPGIVILKLLAFEDRPEIRRDDISDISGILHHFFDMFAESIYENHNDLFGSDRQLIDIAAHVLGREMSKIAKLNPDLYQRIKQLLVKNTVDPKTSEIAKVMAEFFSTTIQDNIRLINHIYSGYSE